MVTLVFVLFEFAIVVMLVVGQGRVPVDLLAIRMLILQMCVLGALQFAFVLDMSDPHIIDNLDEWSLLLAWVGLQGRLTSEHSHV